MLTDAIFKFGKKKLWTPLTPISNFCGFGKWRWAAFPSASGPSAVSGRTETHASLIACSRNCQPSSPPGLQPHPLVRGPPSPLLLAPQTAAMCVLVPQKSAGVYGRAQKLCCLIAMLSMQPRIESGRLSLRKRASATVKVFS
jgi:hypothetical protein